MVRFECYKKAFVVPMASDWESLIETTERFRNHKYGSALFLIDVSFSQGQGGSPWLIFGGFAIDSQGYLILKYIATAAKPRVAPPFTATMETRDHQKWTFSCSHQDELLVYKKKPQHVIWEFSNHMFFCTRALWKIERRGMKRKTTRDAFWRHSQRLMECPWNCSKLLAGIAWDESFPKQLQGVEPDLMSLN